MSLVKNMANNTGNGVEIYEVWGWLDGRVIPEAVFVLYCFTDLDVCKEDGFILEAM